MKKNILMLALTATLSTSLFAALPPLAQNARELDAIFVSPELTEKLNAGSSVKLIKRLRGNRYIVITDKQKMIVDIVYTSSSSQNVGPQKFNLVFHDPITLEHDDDDYDNDYDNDNDQRHRRSYE